MAKFKVGDRVRIIHDHPDYFGREATIYRIATWRPEDASVLAGEAEAGETCYDVDVDGVGKKLDGYFLSYCDYDLQPLTPPAIDQWATEQVKRVTKPQPVVELPKVKA